MHSYMISNFYYHGVGDDITTKLESSLIVIEDVGGIELHVVSSITF